MKSSAAKNPHGFAWDHDIKGNQFLVIGKKRVHVMWRMAVKKLRAALAVLGLTGEVIRAAIRFIKEYRVDVGVQVKAIA